MDAPSFEEFYRSQYSDVVRLAFVLTGRIDVAEELTQEAFLACHRQWDRVSRYDDPTAWVRRVATNRCISSGRRHLTELRLLTKLRRERRPNPELCEDSERLWEIVRSLPRRQAQVIALAFVDDLDTPSIAATLGIGEETVRTHMRRGRMNVADQLSEESDHG